MPLDGSRLSQLAQDLIAAKKLIEDERNWCQGRARDGNKKCSAAAVVDSVNGVNAPIRRNDALREIAQQGCGFRDSLRVAEFNDANDHATVMAAWDRAIAKAMEG